MSVFLQNQNTWQTIGHFQSLIDRMSSSAQSEISDCEEILTKYYQTMAYYDEVAALATQRPWIFSFSSSFFHLILSCQHSLSVHICRGWSKVLSASVSSSMQQSKQYRDGGVMVCKRQ